EIWLPHRACFVSLKTVTGALRGCIGTIYPAQADLGREIMANAVSAATRDPRFPPLTPGEQAGVVFSVDVLSEPEPVADWGDLDPARWGVIVRQGGRRGLLLPALDGVNTVEQQITIAARKAGISDLKNIELQRFSVERHPEKAGEARP
ncbi:MAG: AmmeMemoRadiSam system protein A, partial [Candidatus Adiutrix sp.]|nr:AmmeMemoRadiSam system protein A [Candidatus Adiutrix sp.]